jgi:hypothetical protein
MKTSTTCRYVSSAPQTQCVGESGGGQSGSGSSLKTSLIWRRTWRSPQPDAPTEIASRSTRARIARREKPRIIACRCAASILSNFRRMVSASAFPPSARAEQAELPYRPGFLKVDLVHHAPPFFCASSRSFSNSSITSATARRKAMSSSMALR